jgi:hypothetical protein
MRISGGEYEERRSVCWLREHSLGSGTSRASAPGSQLDAVEQTQRGDIPEATRQLQPWVAGSVVILACLLVATWDMVFMPGL